MRPARPPLARAVRFGRALPLGLAVLLAACSLGAPRPAVSPRASAAPKARAAAKLQKPAAGTTVLAGRVTLDGAYALAQGGRLVDRAAGPVVAVGGARGEAGGARLVSDQGGGLIAEAEGNVIGQGAAGVAEDLGDGTLLAGGAILSNNGGGVVSTGGNGVVSNNGGAVVSTGGNGYALAQGAAAPAIGTELPMAGMLVSVVSLADRRYVPLGVDARGEPVHAVYTNVAGGFEVHLPASAPTNLLVVASAPGARDRRLSLNVVVARGSATAEVGELDRLVSRYVRRAFTNQLVATLKSPALARALASVEPTLTERGRADLIAFVDVIERLAGEAGLPADADDARLRRAAQRLLDLALADLDLATVRIDAADIAPWGDRPPMPVLEGFRRDLADLLEGAGAQLRADPGFFSQAWLEGVMNAPVGDRPSPPLGDWEGAIRTPGDVGEFLLVEYLGALRENFSEPVGRLARTLYGAAEPGLAPADRAARADEFVTVLYGAGMQTMLAFARRVATEPALSAEGRKILAEP